MVTFLCSSQGSPYAMFKIAYNFNNLCHSTSWTDDVDSARTSLIRFYRRIEFHFYGVFCDDISTSECIALDNWWMMDWKSFGKKRSWLNRGSILAIAWKNWGIPRISQNNSYFSRYLTLACPEYKYRALQLHVLVNIKVFNFEGEAGGLITRGLVLMTLNGEGCMRCMQQQFGTSQTS
jgi:hypothetical protein